MDNILIGMSTLYDEAFKDGVDFCIEVLQSYSGDNNDAAQYIKDVYDTMMGKIQKKGD